MENRYVEVLPRQVSIRGAWSLAAGGRQPLPVFKLQVGLVFRSARGGLWAVVLGAAGSQSFAHASADDLRFGSIISEKQLGILLKGLGPF